MTPERLEKLTRVAYNRRFDLTVVLENVHDPHNIAAVLRSCDAVGIQEIYVINNAVQFKSRVGHKSSSSANKWVKVHSFKTVAECMQIVKQKYNHVLCTHLNADAKSIYDLDFTESIALVFGNEKDGVTSELLAACTGNFIIPQIGMISSLNISVACAVTLYECFRQRNSINYTDKFLDKKETLLQDWIKRNDA